MRQLFIVLAKVMGVFQAYLVVVNVLTIVSTYLIPHVDNANTVVAGLCLLVVGNVAFSWVLLVRTGWLADKLGIRDEGISGEFPKDRLLKLGVQLVGLYVVSYSIPALFRSAVEYSFVGGYGPMLGALSSHVWGRLAEPMIRTVIGVLLLARSDYVLTLVLKAEQARSRGLCLAVMVGIAAIVIIGTILSVISHGVSNSSFSSASSVTEQIRHERNVTTFNKETNSAWYDTPYWRTPEVTSRTPDTKVKFTY